MSAQSSNRNRSFRIVRSLFRVFVLMIIIFCCSGLVTIAMRTPYPAAYMLSYLDDVKDFFIEPEEKSEKNFTVNGYPVSENLPEKNDEGKTFGNESKKVDGVFDKLGLLVNIKNEVDAKIKGTRNYTPLEDMAPSFRQAIVSVEDSRFYKHAGFDVGGIARAAVVNAKAGQVEEGASTITQQLIKNLFLSDEPSFMRKAEELLLSVNLERNFSKEKILEIYLNTIYFGSNFYGIYEASHGYFGKDPKDLTVGESAMLAGLPNAPSLYSPYVDFMLAKKRQLIVIDSMQQAGYLSEKEAENARIEEIILVK